MLSTFAGKNGSGNLSVVLQPGDTKLAVWSKSTLELLRKYWERNGSRYEQSPENISYRVHENQDLHQGYIPEPGSGWILFGGSQAN